MLLETGFSNTPVVARESRRPCFTYASLDHASSDEVFVCATLFCKHEWNLMQAWPEAFSNGKLTPDSNGTNQPRRTPPMKQESPVVVWYKHDLRVHDHPGLSKALASKRPVVAFFCFDDLAWSDQVRVVFHSGACQVV